MSVSDGQAVNAAISNAAWMSRTTNTSTIGVVDLNNVTDVDSGAQITNAQQALNETFDAVGMTGIDDATRKDYSSNNVVANNDSHKTAIGKLDTDIILKVVAPSSTDNAVARYNGTAGQIQDSGVLIDDSDNMTIPGTLDVTGNILGVARWEKFTVTHTALQIAALTNDIELFSLLSQGVIHGVMIKHSVLFAGTGITDYKISVGIVGELDKYATDSDVDTAVSATNFFPFQTLGLENVGGATSIRIAATSVGANLDQSTGGSVDVWVYKSILP